MEESSLAVEITHHKLQILTIITFLISLAIGIGIGKLVDI
jgi:hypothetical protein